MNGRRSRRTARELRLIRAARELGLSVLHVVVMTRMQLEMIRAAASNQNNTKEMQ